jgi:hopanoid biosynthesis associated protein HpnK
VPSRLIVNADDFGLTEAVNRGIALAYDEGIVTSTSLMACGGAFDHAVELARARAKLGVGVHLTLTQERPASDVASVKSLVGADGRFPIKVSTVVRRYVTGRIDLDEVRREFEAQFARVADAGLAVTHFDGHQHVHVLPGVLAVAREVGARFGIEAARCPCERIRWGSPLRVAQLWVLRRFVAAGDWSRLRHPDELLGFAYGGRIDKRNLEAVIDRITQTGTTELMCHPGEADDASPYRRWGYAWEAELAALTDPAVAGRIRGRGIELVSYRALG